MANALFEDNKKEYTKRLNELKKRYQEKLKAALDDAREKFRFTVSELVLKQIINNREASAAEIVAALKDKKELINIEREAVKRLVKAALGEVLTEYVKELTALNVAFDERDDLSARTFYITDKTSETNKELQIITEQTISEACRELGSAVDKLNGGKFNNKENNDSDNSLIEIFCPNQSDELN